MRYLSLLPVVLAVGCAGSVQRTYHVVAMNTAEESVKAVVLVDGQVRSDATGKPLLTPADVLIDHQNPPKTVRIGVRAVVEDEDGNIVRGLEAGDVVPFLDDAHASRSIYHHDPPKQVFFLLHNLDYEEP